MSTGDSNRNTLDQVIESARRLGVELDEADALEWVQAMSVEALGGDVVVDVNSGTYGHRVTMLDISPTDLVRFRRTADIVGIPDRQSVLTALALSGSAAQNRIQRFPSDLDFFERVHIVAPTREAAYDILAEVIREKALATLRGPTHRLMEVKFGTWDADVELRDEPVRSGSPISWRPAEVEGGQLVARTADGSTRTVTWAEASANPGWCKIDWIVADAERGQLSNASNVLDVTWEAPDGAIVALDGFLEPYFQEVYLETDTLPLFAKLIKQLSTDAVAEYVAQLEHEVYKYSEKDPNWGKVARRLYNIFRLTGKYPEAVYIRALFDAPTTVLYQVSALLRTIQDAATEGTPFARDLLVGQCDQLIMSAIGVLTGPSEAVFVSHLLKLRDQVAGQHEGDEGKNIIPAREVTMQAVNDYFRERLLALPSIAEYIEKLSSTAAA